MTELTENNIDINIVSGCEGEALYINDYRVSGPKPWGGGRVVKCFETTKNDILRSLDLPSYQEVQVLKAQLAEYKELLRECQPYIKSEKENWIQQGYWDAGEQILKISNLLTKIKEVLR